MRVVIQRVARASVAFADQADTDRRIGPGLLLFLGIEEPDGESDIQWLVPKISQIRLFADEAGKMNLDIRQVGGSFLVISQFTLHASCKKGNRPSFIRAARPDRASALYDRFIRDLSSFSGCPVETGIFGADMSVALVNDGPVTILLDSQNRE